MAQAEFKFRMWIWFEVVAFGRCWVVYSFPDVPGRWQRCRPRLAWSFY